MDPVLGFRSYISNWHAAMPPPQPPTPPFKVPLLPIDSWLGGGPRTRRSGARSVQTWLHSKQRACWCGIAACTTAVKRRTTFS